MKNAKRTLFILFMFLGPACGKVPAGPANGLGATTSIAPSADQGTAPTSAPSAPTVASTGSSASSSPAQGAPSLPQGQNIAIGAPVTEAQVFSLITTAQSQSLKTFVTETTGLSLGAIAPPNRFDGTGSGSGTCASSAYQSCGDDSDPTTPTENPSTPSVPTSAAKLVSAISSANLGSSFVSVSLQKQAKVAAASCLTSLSVQNPVNLGATDYDFLYGNINVCNAIATKLQNVQ